MKISAYVPCYNNQASVWSSVESIRRQTVPVHELFVVDDSSTDGSAELLLQKGVEVIQLKSNHGRGHVRALAIERSQGELVLCCDATNVLPPEFVEGALRWFSSPQVAAVFGRINQPAARTATERWRGRHLFRLGASRILERRAPLITYGTIVRRDAVQNVGGFNPALRHSEDTDLGERLLKAGYEVIADPSLEVCCNARNSIGQLLERHWRWNAGKDEEFGMKNYLRAVWYSARSMATVDLRAGDPLAAGISLLLPQYQLWRYVKRRLGF